MSLYAHIKRCLELADRDIATALADRRHAKALLDQLAKVSKPSDGAPKLLLVFAKMAAQQVEWIDGAIRIEMVGDADVTVVEVLCELGLGMHERVFPSFKMNVPLEEFARAVERVPHMIEPLSIATKSGRRLVLAAEGDEEGRSESVRPLAPSIHDDSLYDSAQEQAAPAPAKQFVKLEPAPKRPISSGRHRAAPRKGSKPEIPAQTLSGLAPATGKTRPSAPPDSPREAPASQKPRRATPPPLPMSERPSSRARGTPPPLPLQELVKREGAAPPSSKPIVVPKAPLLPRSEKAVEAGMRNVVARVALAKVAATRATPGTGPRRNSKPPGARSKPPPKASPSGARPSKPPPSNARGSKSPPARARPQISEPPDEEQIDHGWDDE